MSDSLLDHLNPPQREAVEHGEGPLLILAGAGSGKTRVITHRIAHLIDRRHVPPQAILAVTFTNKAAQEMRERVETLLDPSGSHVQLGTFHSICARFLRRFIDRIGYSTSFSIYDSADQLALVKAVVKDLNIATDRFKPSALLHAIGRYKLDMLEPREVPPAGFNVFESVAVRVYEEYQRRLKIASALDFDDLLNLSVRLLQKDEEIRRIQNRMWRHILVDEYQDTNKAQYTLLRLLTREHHNICVVGDDDQSIYRWRGADISNIRSFEKDYPKARVVRLEQNYRSTGRILDAAHDVIRKNADRKEKKLWTDLGRGERITVYAAETETREAQFVVDEIDAEAERRELTYKDFAVFYRTNAQSRVLEKQLVAMGIPYTIIGGLRFYERKEVKDALAYLRVLANRRDEVNLLRIVNTPPRGIGAATVAKLRQVAAERNACLQEGMETAIMEKRLSKGPLEKIKAFSRLLKELRGLSERLPLNELLFEVIEKTGYRQWLESEGLEAAEERLANLAELVNEAAEFVRMMGEDASLETFLERTALVSDIDGFDEEKDRVALMTVHSAKGLEFPVVFMVGMEEQLFPHSLSYDQDIDMEEERRLAYVGITRARRKLYMTLARTRMLFGSTRANLPSRFLNDIDPARIDDRGFFARSAKPAFSGRTFAAETPRRAAEPDFDFDRDYTDETPPEEPEYEPAFDVDTGEPVSGIQPGSKVYHPTYGVGKAVAVAGSGADAKVTVMFPSQPLKKIVARYLQLIP